MNDLMSLGLHRRTRWRWPICGMATVCWRWTGGTGDIAHAFLPRRSQERHRGAHRSTRRCCARVATACWTKACCSRPSSAMPSKLRSPTPLFRRRQRGLRTAQHDPQGAGVGRDGAGTAPRRAPAGTRVLQGCRPTWPGSSIGTRSMCYRSWASGWPAKQPTLPLPCWSDPHAPRPGHVEVDDEGGRLRPCRCAQPSGGVVALHVSIRTAGVPALP